MFINWALKEINLKIVYYGPALSGKTTNLLQIHDHVNPAHRSEMVSLKTTDDRTLYFDFMQVKLKPIARLNPRLHLYTVPGQAQYEVSRKLVLRGADGVVFVADSQRDRLSDNHVSWQNLAQQLRENGLSINEIPVVIQCNKQDLGDSLTIDKIKLAMRLNGQYPVIASAAINNQGVQETLGTVIRLVITRVDRIIQDARQKDMPQEVQRPA